MSKTNKTHRKSWRNSWVAAVLLILLIIAIILIIIFVVKPINPTVSDQPSQTPVSSSSANNSTSVENNDPNPASNEQTTAPEAPENKTPHYEGQDPNTLHDLTGSVPYYGVENSTLTILTNIDQYLTSDGTCDLTLTNVATGAVKSYSVAAIADVTTSSCERFEIPATNLPAGKYQASIKLSAGGKTGLIEKEIEL